MHRPVAIVGFGEHSMHAVLLEQRYHYRAERLARQALALASGRQRHSDLGGRRLVGHDS